MDPARALEILSSTALDRAEAFYGDDAGLPLGVGLIIDGVEFTTFDPTKDRFSVIKGLVYLLTHECDLDGSNDRILNDLALICPILPLEELLVDCEKAGIPDHEMGAILGNLGKRNISRAVYMPPYGDLLPVGGLLYLNQVTSTPTCRLIGGTRVCSVTGPGLTAIDMALENHLRRPKPGMLPLERGGVRYGSSRVDRSGPRAASGPR